MAVKIRMTRIGRRHRPFFRINAVDGQTPRDGRILEKLGHYDPIEKDPAKQIVLSRERIEYWLDKGAVPSDSVSQILLRAGIKHKYAEKRAARNQQAKAIARAKGRYFTKAEKIAAEKAIEETEAKAKAQAEAKAKAEAEVKAEGEAKAKAEGEAKAKQDKQQESKAEEAKKVESAPESEAQAKSEVSKPAEKKGDEKKTEAEAKDKD